MKGVGTRQTNLSQLQSTKALMSNALAGLLTYSTSAPSSHPLVNGQ